MREFAKLSATFVEVWLDKGAGCCALSDFGCPKAIDSALRHFDSKRYQLFCSVIMPNHIHAIIKAMGEHILDDIWEGWKKFTATQLSNREVSI